MRLNQRRLAFLFLYPFERSTLDQMTLSFSLATFCLPNSLFAFSSLQLHLNIVHRRDYDEQKAVVLVEHHNQGCQLKAKHAST